MTASTSLDKYTKAKHAIDAHIEANKQVFEDHQNLVFNLVDAENALRDDVAEEGKGISNADFQVVYEPVTQEVVDMEALKAYINAGTVSAGILRTNKRPPLIIIRQVPQV